MKLKQKINITLLSLASMIALSVAPVVANAATNKCGDVDTSIIGGDICKDVTNKGDIQNNGVWALLLLAINILTAAIGVVAVGGIVYGSILYASAGDKTEQVKKAITVIMNVVIGLVAYIAMYAILQFLIPGGIFS